MHMSCLKQIFLFFRCVPYLFFVDDNVIQQQRWLFYAAFQNIAIVHTWNGDFQTFNMPVRCTVCIADMKLPKLCPTQVVPNRPQGCHMNSSPPRSYCFQCTCVCQQDYGKTTGPDIHETLWKGVAWAIEEPIKFQECDFFFFINLEFSDLHKLNNKCTADMMRF